MNNIDYIKMAIEDIEEHLTDDIGLKDIADNVNFSEYHFHRLFKSLTGYSLKDYIRKRRLTLAAIDLSNGMSIIEVSNKYLFSSQSSFSVAFKHLHGLTPGVVKRNCEDYQVFGKVVLSDTPVIRPKGLLSEPSIEFVKGMQLYGDSIQVNYDELLSKDNPIDELWTSKVGLDSNQLTEEKSIYAVYDYDPSDIYKESLSFTYSLCINKKGNKVIISDHLYLMFQVDLSLISLFDVYDFIDEQ